MNQATNKSTVADTTEIAVAPAIPVVAAPVMRPPVMTGEQYWRMCSKSWEQVADSNLRLADGYRAERDAALAEVAELKAQLNSTRQQMAAA